jgi:hypothetical protein
MKITQLIVVTALITSASLGTQSALAEECQVSACVDVYTQDGTIIIEGRQGGTPAVTPAPTAKAIPQKVAPKKVVPKKIAPPPVKKKVVPPKPKVTAKSVPKKSTPTPQPPAAQTASLNDRLIKALPTAGIAYQPEYEPLVDVPVFMWTDLPTSFMTQVKIVGEIVDVALRPSFTWSFGDGTFLSTTDVGGPFPNGKIKHTYSNPGTYLITLISTWNGTYTHNAQTRAITGTVKTTSIVTITVVNAPTRFVN